MKDLSKLTSEKTRTSRDIRNISKSFEHRIKMADKAITSNIALLEPEMIVLCRLLRANPTDFSLLLNVGHMDSNELLPILHGIIIRDEEPIVHVRTCDVLAFRGNRSSVTPLSMLITGRGVNGNAANAAIDTIFGLALNSHVADTHVFRRGLENIRQSSSLSPRFKAPIEEILNAVTYKKRKRLPPNEALFWARKNNSHLAKRFYLPRLRVANRISPNTVPRLPQKC